MQKKEYLDSFKAMKQHKKSAEHKSIYAVSKTNHFNNIDFFVFK